MFDGQGVLYDWEEEVNYGNLTEEKIQQGMHKADEKNKQTFEQATNEQLLWDGFVEPEEITEEDKEMINEFLEV